MRRLGAITLPVACNVEVERSSHLRCNAPPPPPVQAGYLSDTCVTPPPKVRRNECDTPSMIPSWAAEARRSR